MMYRRDAKNRSIDAFLPKPRLIDYAPFVKFALAATHDIGEKLAGEIPHCELRIGDLLFKCYSHDTCAANNPPNYKHLEIWDKGTLVFSKKFRKGSEVYDLTWINELEELMKTPDMQKYLP